MSVISRLILVQPDSLLRESLRFGFEREGVSVAACGSGDAFEPDLFARPAEVVIAGGRTGDEARSILSLVRGVLSAASREPPVLYVGNGIARTQAMAEGATEFLGQPVYVRDAVTVAKLLAGRKRDNPSVLTGDLGEHFGLFYLVRAISAIRRRGVLTLVRGMRRGELRFYDGEVTSAQVGLLHGLAALHQLLLWTEGRFELRPEDVVRRQQIPLEPNELFADAERFLSEICTVAGDLSPSACYERDDPQINRVSGRIPPAVATVLRLFDGVRTVADVVEDCQYRVFETLRISNRLSELGLIRLRYAARARHTAHAALAIEEWLVGDKSAREVKSSPGHVVVGKPAQGAAPDPDAATHARRRAEKMIERRRRRRPRPGHKQRGAGQSHGADRMPGGQRLPAQPQRSDGAAPVAAARPGSSGPIVVDWAQLLPDAIESELVLSPVVPSSVAAGEISVVATEPRAVEARPEAVIAQGGRPMTEAEAAPSRADRHGRRAIGSAPVPSRDEPRHAAAAPAEKPAEPSVLRAAQPSATIPEARKVVEPARPRREVSEPPHWSPSEEAFFARGHEEQAEEESFDDLDEGLHQPQSFWRRLFRPSSPPASGSADPKSRHRRRP
jgi:hypothetical protein